MHISDLYTGIQRDRVILTWTKISHLNPFIGCFTKIVIESGNKETRIIDPWKSKVFTNSVSVLLNELYREREQLLAALSPILTGLCVLGSTLSFLCPCLNDAFLIHCIFNSRFGCNNTLIRLIINNCLQNY